MRLALALSLLPCLAFPAHAQDQAPPASLRQSVPTLVTTATASRDIVPDGGRLSLGIVVEGATSAEVVARNAELSQKVLAKAGALGIASADLATRAVDVAPLVEEERDLDAKLVRSVAKGWRATTLLRVRLRDVSRAGDIARALMDAGANRFDGIDFTASAIEAARDDLRVDALSLARGRAKRYTDALNLRLGRPIEILPDVQELPDGEADLPQVVARPGTAQVVPYAIPLVPGSITVSAKVQITWEILP